MVLDGGWGVGVTKHFKHNMASKRKQGKRSRFEVGITDAESDTDSDNKLYLTQATGLLKTERCVDRPVQVTIHKTVASEGVIRCKDL